MNISDTFYVALCMTILIIGVVYWFWTQNQYIQRKLNLLENIVYEMKTSINNIPVYAPPQDHEIPEQKPVYPPAPSSELGDDEDLLHETLHSEISGEVQPVELPVEQSVIKNDIVEELIEKDMKDDLQPGGVGSSLDLEVVPDKEVKGSNLESMTLKELRRLAEQRNVVGASSMRKQALIDALHGTVTPNTLEVPLE